MFTLDDTIRVVGVKGQFDEKGNAYPVGSAPDLVLHVCGRDPSTNLPVVYAVNGAKNAAIFAAEILAVKDPTIAKALVDYRKKMVLEVEAKAERVAAQL